MLDKFVKLLSVPNQCGDNSEICASCLVILSLVLAFNGVQFDMALLYPVLALALTHGQVAGLPACFYSGASLIRFYQPRRRHLPRTDKSYHFFPIFVSRIQTEANTRGINLLHLPLFIGNSDGIPVFTFLDRTCSILEEVSIFFLNFTAWISNADWKVVFHWSSRFTYVFVGNVLGYPFFSREFI